MAVDMDGFDIKIKTTGIIHRTGEHVRFTLENEKGNPKNPVLTFFTPLTPPPAGQTSDQLYFCARGAIQRITFRWGSDGKILGCGRRIALTTRSM